MLAHLQNFYTKNVGSREMGVSEYICPSFFYCDFVALEFEVSGVNTSGV